MEKDGLEVQSELVLSRFDFAKAALLLERIGGFFSWTPDLMRNEFVARVNRMRRDASLICVSSGGLRVGRDRFGYLFVELDVYGDAVQCYEVPKSAATPSVERGNK